jgi:hypothetical protein
LTPKEVVLPAWLMLSTSLVPMVPPWDWLSGSFPITTIWVEVGSPKVMNRLLPDGAPAKLNVCSAAGASWRTSKV